MKKIKPYLIKQDNRGIFRGIMGDRTWEEVNYVETKKDTIRGNHYHKKTLEAFYIISGKIKISITNLKNKKQKELLVKKGDIFIVDPYELHTFKTLENSSWINMLSERMSDKNKDIHQI